MRSKIRLDEISQESVDSVKESFNRLPKTNHLDGQYRLRRYSRVKINETYEFSYFKLPQQEFNQSKDYNKHQGGMSRTFEDIEDDVVRSVGMLEMCDKFLESGGFSADNEIEVHQMRIITSGEVARTQVSREGIHQDGYDFIAIVGIDRYNISGGNALVYKTHGGKQIFDCPLQPKEMLMINDRQLWHNAGTIAKLDQDKQGYMDAFILTARNNNG